MRVKDRIKLLLEEERFDDILELEKRPTKSVRTLMGLLYRQEESLRHGAAYVLGLIAKRVYPEDQEIVRQILQKLLWSLNDESGFVCWGAPEAIGEIVRNIPDLKPIYAQFLISFLCHPQVVLNNDYLERGTLIALARIGKLDNHLKKQLEPILQRYIDGDDREMRELALWCGLVTGIGKRKDIVAPGAYDETSEIFVYESGVKVKKPLSEIEEGHLDRKPKNAS